MHALAHRVDSATAEMSD